MAFSIKDPEVEKLAAEVARLAKESKTEAVRRALLERKERLERRESKRARLDTLLRRRIWPSIPREMLGSLITREEEEKILGYGPAGF